jgi:hypothetical protein
MVEHMPTKGEALRSNPNSAQKRRKEVHGDINGNILNNVL